MRSLHCIYILNALILSGAAVSQIKVTPAITHVGCVGSTNGSVQLTPTGTGTPYTYTWVPGNTTGNTISNKGLGAYQVTIKNTGASTLSVTYNIGYKTRWQNFYPGMTTTSNGDILVNSTGSPTWLKVAECVNQIPASTDGWIEYVVSTTAHNKLFGFMDAGSPSGWNNIDFAMMLNSGGSLNTQNNGSPVSLGGYAVGDVLRIERVGSVINYRKNNSVIWTTTITPTMVASTLQIRAGLYDLTATLEHLGCSAPANIIPPDLGTGIVSTTNLLGYWPFDGNANDLSGNGNNGTVTSASLTADRFGNPGKAYYFNGSTSRIDVPNSTTVNMTTGNDYTMAFWLKTNPGNVFTAPISKAPINGGITGYHFFVNNTNSGFCNGTGKFTYYVAAGQDGDACANNLISNDAVNWYFITGQYKSSTNETFLYVNGVLQNDIGSALGTLSNTSQLTFGACGCGPYQFYNGYLDDIRFYKRLLTQAEINTLYNEPNPISEISCSTPSITLIGYSPTAGVTYSWSPGGVTTSSVSVTAAGTYTLRITDPTNGCFAASTVSVIEIPCTNYFMLKKTLDGGYYNSYKSRIYFSFEEEYYDPAQGSINSLNYRIVTDKNVPVAFVGGLIEVIGYNKFTIDLSTIGGTMVPGGFYRLAITNKKNEVFYADFKY